jgi:hypothetical protein
MPISLDTLLAARARMRQVMIPKLAASPIQPLQVKPNFSNELLQSHATWPQDVNYMRDIYDEIYINWESNPFQTPEHEKALYELTEPRLEELVKGLKDISMQRSGRADLYKSTERAGHDAQVASLYAQGGDYAMASMYQSYALTKVHNMLEAMTREGKQRKASFLVKKGYGYDVSGEVQDGSGTNNNQKHLWDTAQPQDGHTTPKPQGNINMDTEALQEFPELKEKKLHKVHFPPRID